MDDSIIEEVKSVEIEDVNDEPIDDIFGDEHRERKKALTKDSQFPVTAKYCGGV